MAQIGVLLRVRSTPGLAENGGFIRTTVGWSASR